ncbi:germinal-center associated nuclear protein-like [Amphiura filiformis]|uniref:germinal-center associated nuclear protein-like n=1 Tax=Amphiura filiformis TaxID=82378 RepID=UPI003B20C8B1
MSSLSFGQKKKKQALRRLSQQGATPRSARSRPDQSKQSWPPRRRSREDAEEFSPGRSGSRETKRTRSSAAYSGDSDSSGSSIFAGRRIVHTSDSSQNLVISKPFQDVSSDTGTDSDSTGKQPAGATGGIFGRLQTGHFGQDEPGNFDAGIIKPATTADTVRQTPTSSNIFAKALSGEERPVQQNPFASRVTQISSSGVSKPSSSQVTTSSAGSSTFRFAVPAAKDPPTSTAVKFAPTSSSVFGKSSFGKQEPSGMQSFAMPTSESGQGFSNFSFTVKQTTAGPASTSTTSTSQATGVPQGPVSGPQTSSSSPFTFRQPGSKHSPHGTDSAGVFGMKSDVPKSEPSAIHKFTFAKPKSEGLGSPTSSRSPTKRPLSSSQQHADSYTKRPIAEWSDPFSEAQEEDLSDLETFGADFSQPPKEPKKPAILREGSLFGRAIGDAKRESDRSDRRGDRRSDRGDDRRGPDSRRDDDRRRRREEDRGKDDRRHKEESRRQGDEENKTGSSKISSGTLATSLGRRFTSADDISKRTSIVIKNVPDMANTRTFLKKFFSEYGTVTKVNSMPSKTTAVIHFDNHNSAAMAKKKTRILMRGTKPVTIFWSQSESSARPSSRQSEKAEKPSLKESTLTRALAPKNRTENAPAPRDKPKPRQRGTDSLRKQVGMSAQERMDILEARDKMIRPGYKKQFNLATAQAVKGTCPDMCPEKERYMREYQRRLSVYETLNAQDKVHHPSAVKEYSRSSADQEEPLPHELRPANVLMMTMNYLINNIMNRGEEGRWEDWFDFLWNRTRAIRKDITQQHMCDVSAVELMEKCARFHIFCAHRLCNQDRAIFDPKINNENLTKCLQSLRQFYHDLANEGIYCPSEAEFRTYDVLLNLNEGDMLRQVQHYRPEVRGSENVKFAIKTFSAVNSNNYVKFFKLVRSASYLNACSMHRYFTQMRNNAILVMSKAYRGPRTTLFPLEDLIRLLAFEGEAEATEFCEAHGLPVSDGTVQFSRSSFLEPESAIVAFRSISIIETKNDKSIGEIVNGGLLPPNYIHEPMSSFNEMGQYKGDITSSTTTLQHEEISQKEEEETGEIQSSVGEETTSMVEKTEPVRRTHQYSNAAVKDVAKEMFIEVINDMAKELSQNFLQWVHFVQTGSFELVNKVLGESLSDLSREVAMETYREEYRRVEEKRLAEQRRLEQERQQKEQAAARERQMQERERQMQERERLRQESIDRVSAETIENIIDEVVAQESHNLAIINYREVQAQLTQESVARSSEVINSEILEETLLEQCHHLADDVIQMAIQQRDEKLAELEKCILMSRTARYLQKWQRVYTLRVRLKRSQLTFPAAPPNHSLLDQLQGLWPSRDRQQPGRGQESISGITLDTPFSVLSSQETVAKTILRRHYLTCLRKQKAWASFDLPTMLRNTLHQSQHASQLKINHLYWKLVMSLPEVGPQMSHDWSESFDWLQAKLKRGKLQDRFCEETLHDSEKVQTLSLYTAEVETQPGHQSHPMSICTKVTKGHVRDYELGCNQLLGTSALLFVLDDLEEIHHLTSSVPVFSPILQTDWSEAYQRLVSLVDAKPVNPPIPVLVVILSDQCNTSNVQTLCEEGLRLPYLQHGGLLSVYHVMSLAVDIEDPRASEELSEGLQWLATHCPPPPHVTEDTVRGYIDTGLMEMFSMPLHEDAKLRRKAGLPEQDAQYVVSLYNSVVAHLAAVASSRSLMDLSWPLMEFGVAQRENELPKPNWNLPKVLRLLNDRILGLRLPDVPHVHQDCDWKVVWESLHNYVLDLLPGREVDKAPLISRVQWLLDRSRRSFQNTCYLNYDTPGCEPTARHIPWLSIIEACITHMVTVMSAEDDNYADDDPVTIYYFKSEFDSFTSPQEWKHARTTTREDTFTHPNSFNQSVLETVQQRQTQLAETHSTDNITHEGSFPKIVLEDEPPSVVAAKDTAEYLKIRLHAEKQETQRYEDLLSSWLSDGSPQIDLNTSMESIDEGTPLTVHIPQWHDGKATIPAVDGSAVRRDETRGASGGGEETLSERLAKLKQQIATERRAEELEELRLAQLLGL